MSYNLTNEIAVRASKNIYIDKTSVIKLFKENYSKADILNEALNLSRVEENTDLNIPKLKEVTKIGKRWALVTEYVEGKSMQELMDKNPKDIDKYLEMFVDIQLEVLSKKVPLLSRIKDKFKRKITETDLIDEDVKYELLQRLEGMKNHTKLCHGDFNPENIIITEKGKYYICDWSHATQGNASADSARTFLLFSIQGKDDLANRYLELFCLKSGIEKGNVQRWIPIVAATQMTKGKEEEREFLSKWINVAEYQ
ncbi:MAG: phosphotransferase [Clostridia bacterium]|nr:phosphotransferase [Clostridia bacterium]